jgi:predicted transcriptional regulator of viral defense system
VSDLLTMPAEELLERVEAAAADGVKGAAATLRSLIEALEAEGRLSRLAAGRYVRDPD